MWYIAYTNEMHRERKEGIIVKNGIKSLATWLIIGIILIVVISSIIDNTNSKMTYSELVENIGEENVESIEFNSDGDTAYVTLKSEKELKRLTFQVWKVLWNFLKRI